MLKTIRSPLISLIILATLLSVAGVTYIILGVPGDRIAAFSIEGYESEHRLASTTSSELEEGALLNVHDLKTYYSFSSMEAPYSEWIAGAFSKNSLKYVDKRRGLIAVNAPLMLKGLLRNSCEKVYCHQFRLPFDKIPSVFWKGLIGIEDSRYLNHFGIDPKSLLRAAIVDIKSMKLKQGGSTLTQQLVKNLFFSNEKSLSRKIKEMIVSVYIESVFSKEEILESYFNEVYWGALQGMRIKGLFAASVYYFGIRPAEATSYQAAILIALLKGPHFYNPIKRLERLRDRTSIVYQKLVSLGLFSDGPGQVWSLKKWNRWKRSLELRNRERGLRALWSTVRNDSASANSYGHFVFHKKAQMVLRNAQKRANHKGIAVKAFLGHPFNNKRENFYYYSKEERNKKVAIFDERHQLGSTLKPILYGIFVENGKSINDEVSTAPISFSLKSGKWSPREAHAPGAESITLLEALQKSYNRPVVRIASELGFKTIEKDLFNYISRLKTPLAEFPAQLLGAVELSIKEIYDGYLKFIYKQCKAPDQDNLLYLMSDPEKTTVRKVVDKHMKNMRFFGKTGTSNNGNDNWYIFFDGETLGVIWVGLDGKRSTDNLPLYGSTTAFQVFQGHFRDRGKRFNELFCPQI